MILGSGFSQNIANHFSETLNLYGFRATANSHLEFLRENVEKDVLIFIVSNSGDTFRLADLAQMAKDHHIDLIAFVGEKNLKNRAVGNLGHQHRDICPARLVCVSAEPFLRNDAESIRTITK